MSRSHVCKCGHIMSDHEDKSLQIKGELIKRWRGECLVNACPCPKYEHDHISTRITTREVYGEGGD